MSEGERRYPSQFEPNTSHAHAVALLDKSDARPGLVLDLGCGNAPAAEPLADRGFDYVGLDLDRTSLDGLAAGFRDASPRSGHRTGPSRQEAARDRVRP